MQELEALQLALKQQGEEDKKERRRKAKINTLHVLYYAYKLKYHTEPHDVFDMIKGIVFLMEG